MPNTFIDLNKSFEYVGDNSTFQKRITLILSIQWVAFTFIVMGMSYVFRSPKFECVDSNGVGTMCAQEVACNHIKYGTQQVRIDYPSQYSIIEEFGLICS